MIFMTKVANYLVRIFSSKLMSEISMQRDVISEQNAF